ncbi:cell surface glycoprotein CD200 receptor 5-like [Eleutherodactylus coqui]|uniref:cell surface glycoprotein CD200 receptor 5-like n=1 Tax=Eleutherodactylus coqui TaxID=57060 RepID=UPI00346282D1
MATIHDIVVWENKCIKDGLFAQILISFPNPPAKAPQIISDQTLQALYGKCILQSACVPSAPVGALSEAELGNGRSVFSNVSDESSVLVPGSYILRCGDDVVMVRRGRPVVLYCLADPGNTLLQVVWKPRLYNSSCLASYKIDADNNKTSYNNCGTRVRSNDLSLSISDTVISDEGTYTCQVVYGAGTVIRHIVLQVLAQPSTFLKLNSDGSPECGAIGGNPPADISWIPHSDDINTTIVEEPDQTWSVISTLSRERMNGTSVTCVVSHPIFINPWKEVIVLRDYGFSMDLRIMITIIVTVFIVGVLLCLKLKCQSLLTTRCLYDADLSPVEHA